MHIYVEYDQILGQSFRDADCMEYAKAIVHDMKHSSNTELHICVGNELTINCFRLLVKEKELLPEEITFVFHNEYLVPTKAGKLPYWPDGFCDHNMKLLARLARV